jgi:TPR repeat protein
MQRWCLQEMIAKGLPVIFMVLISACVTARDYPSAIKAIEENKFDDAVLILKELSEKGDARAMNKLGELYLFGNGVSFDPQKAYEYFLASANKGDSGGQYDVGNLYMTGIGVPRDVAKAVEWYKESASKGNVDAYVALGNIYANKESHKDLCDAKRWYEKAIESGRYEVNQLIQALDKKLNKNDCSENGS